MARKPLRRGGTIRRRRNESMSITGDGDMGIGRSKDEVTRGGDGVGRRLVGMIVSRLISLSILLNV